MKIYIIRDSNKDIQLVTADCDEAINKLNETNDFHSITYEVKEPETKMKSLSDFGEREYQPLHYNSEIRFGKFKGRTVCDIMVEEPEYLQWAIDNINLKLDEECEQLLFEALDNKKGSRR